MPFYLCLVVIIPLHFVCALKLSNDNKNQWFWMHYYDTWSDEIKTTDESERPYKCYNTLQCTSSLSFCTLCIHIETIDILFIEMTFALYETLCNVIFEKKRTARKKKKKNKCEQISVRFHDESALRIISYKYIFERCVTYRIASHLIKSYFFSLFFYILFAKGCHFHFWLPYLSEHRRDCINYSSNRLIIIDMYCIL